MGTVWQSIRMGRLMLALMITFLIADTYPHPKLHPGVIETVILQIKELAQADSSLGE